MIFVACLLTVLIETPFMAVFGFNKRDEIVVVICSNVITNLLLNLALMYCGGLHGAVIYLLEMLVVAVEYAIYALAFGRSAKLFIAALAANALSYGIGLIIF